MAEHSGNAAGLNPVRQHLQTVLIPNEGTRQGYFTCRERRRRFGVLLPSLFAALLCSRYEAKLKRAYYTFITPSPAPSSLYKSISRKFNFMFCKIVFRFQISHLGISESTLTRIWSCLPLLMKVS